MSFLYKLSVIICLSFFVSSCGNLKIVKVSDEVKKIDTLNSEGIVQKSYYMKFNKELNKWFQATCSNKDKIILCEYTNVALSQIARDLKDNNDINDNQQQSDNNQQQSDNNQEQSDNNQEQSNDNQQQSNNNQEQSNDDQEENFDPFGLPLEPPLENECNGDFNVC